MAIIRGILPRVKGIPSKVRSGHRDFRNGLSIIFRRPDPGAGDRNLAKMCRIVEAQIPYYGKDTVRSQLIKSAENDLRKAHKKGGKEAVDKLLENALDTPEYVRLLGKLGLGEPEIRVLAMEVQKHAKHVRR